MRNRIYHFAGFVVCFSLIASFAGNQLPSHANSVLQSYEDTIHYTPETLVEPIHFFAFNRARLKDDIELQKRGVVAIENITNAVETIPGVQVETLVEPARTIEEYKKNPTPPVVTQKTVFDKLENYTNTIPHQDTFMVYSHTHGLKNYFKPDEPWGGFPLDISTSDLPHKGITTWPQYAEKLLAIPAKNVIVLTMSCYSGGFVEYLETIPDEWNNRASEGRNFLLITSQNSSLMSSPVRIDGTICNPFTYAVQKAFEGEADGYLNGIRDGTTTYQEFVTYLQETTHELDKRAFPQSIGSYEPDDVVFTHSYQPVKLESTMQVPPPLLQPDITISTGFDWTFPYSVLPKDNSGSFYMNTLGERDSIRCVGVTLYWSLLNPKEREYDFSVVNELLKLAEKENIRLVFRLKCSVYDRNLGGSSADKYLPYIPEWVVQKHKPPLFYTYNKPPHFIQVAAPWNPGVQEELKKFIMEFGEQNILSNKYVAGLYVHGISSSPGEEFWLDRRYTQFALDAGMTEDNLNSAFKNRIDWWAEIAGNYVQKLAWVHFGTVQRLDYDVSVLNDYALEKGLGWREGGIESYHRFIAPELGQTMNEEGHIWVDWSYPLRNGNRFFGDEAEVNFSSYSRDIQKHCIESSIFRLVQLGMNYVWTSEPCVELSPEMFAWWTKMAGKNPKETPEATCWLREDYANPGEVTIHNFEHLLVQRDYKGFITKPVQKIHRYPFYTDPKGIDYDYAARSTNIKTNDTGFLFFIDPRFSNTLSSSFMIKVMYLDEKKTNWVLRYGTIDNKIVEQVVIGEGDKQWKTATFHVKSFSKELLDHKADFSINVKNKQDLTVKFVRVIRN